MAEGENPKRGLKGGCRTATVAPVIQVMIWNGGEREVLTAEVQRGTNRERNETERGKDKGTKAETKGKGVKTGGQGEVCEVEREGGNALVHLTHPAAQGLTM